MSRRYQIAQRIVAVIDDDDDETTHGKVIARRLTRRGAHCHAQPCIILEDSDERAERYTHGSVVVDITVTPTKRATPSRPRRQRRAPT